VRVIVNFQLYKKWTIHTIAEDCRTTLGPHGLRKTLDTYFRLEIKCRSTGSDIVKREIHKCAVGQSAWGSLRSVAPYRDQLNFRLLGSDPRGFSACGSA
jgi:hypothetical protein